jgi:hypothetical protein
LFSVLFASWLANYTVFNGDLSRELATQFLALAQKQRATVPLATGHRMLAQSLMFTGHIAESREHFDKGLALYNPAKHRPLAARLGGDARV